MKYKQHPNYNLASRTKDAFSDGLKKRIDTLESVIQKKLRTINGLVFRKGGRGLIGIILKIIRGVRPRSSKSVVKQVCGFCFRCNHIARHSGLKGLTLYLKASQVLLQQVVAGYRVVDLSELKVRPSRNRAGVPLIIPAGVRVRISRDRNISDIKLWMTLLGLYRILEFVGCISVRTITDPGKDLSLFLPKWEHFLENVFKPNLLKWGRLPQMGEPDLFPILKSGPTVSTLDDPPGTSYTNSSARTLVIAARIWLKKSKSNVLLESLKRFLPNMRNSSTFITRLQTVAMVANERIDQYFGEQFPKHSPSLGKLGFKPEPAGKVRVFAMVDAWTQWLLSPLHKWLFNILKRIPQDGTFDQMKPILRLQSMYATNPKGLFASIDLSAATDRLPISLQISLLRVLLKDIVPDSNAFAESWADLLVKRSYRIGLDHKDALSCKKAGKYTYGPDLPREVFYSVGQPMGALSSWAMLAITHHALMQYSAYQVGEVGWYPDYAVLGDDGVIKGGNHTKAYRKLLDTIGVKAGLAKSILSKNKFVIEFAKKFFVDHTTANMLPFKESVATQISTSLVVEFVRKYNLTLNSILSFLGYGYKSKMRVYQTPFFKLGTRLRVLLVWLSHPLSPFGERDYINWLLKKSWTEYHVPSSQAFNKVAERMENLFNKKLKSIDLSLVNYSNSLNSVDKRLDSVYPIPIISMASLNGSDGATVTTNVPWNAILSPELHSSDIDYDYLSAWNEGGMSNHGYRFKKLKDLKIGLNTDELLEEFRFELNDAVEIVSYPSLHIADKIDLLCETYFSLDDLKAKIPKEFWEEKRELGRPFRDFLTIYKIWQELSQPIWAESYGKDLSLPIKPKMQRTERGDLEELVHHQPSSGDMLYFPWVDFLVISILTFLILEYLFGGTPDPVRLPFLYDVISQETELPTIDQEHHKLLAPNVNWVAIGLMTAGATLLLGSIFISYYQGHPWAWIGIFESEVSSNPHITIQTTGIQEIGDSVMTGNVMVSGPLSASSLGLVQIRLENQALLDNLAISPIGDLWISPW